MRRCHPSHLLALVLALVIWPAYAGGAIDSSAGERGFLALRDGDVKAAYALLAPAAQAAAAPAEVRFWAAQAAAALSLWEPTLTHLTGLEAELAPVADEIWARRARALSELGRHAQAIAAWEAARRGPHGRDIGREAAFAIGPLWQALGNPLAAIIALRAATQANASDGRSDGARLQIALLEEAQGNLRGAMTLFGQLAGSARDPVAQQAADALHNLKTRADAARTAGVADAQALPSAEVQASWHTARTLRDAQRLLARKDAPGAVALLQQLIGHGSSSQRRAALHELGNTYVALGRSQDAVAIFDQLVHALPPGSARKEAQYRAAYLAYDAGNYRTAGVRFAEWLTGHPHAANADEALWYMAWCAYHLRQHEAALVHLGRLRRQYSHSTLVGRAEYWSARLLEERHRDAEAGQDYAAAAARPGYYGLLARLRMDAAAQTQKSLQPASLAAGTSKPVQAVQRWHARVAEATAGLPPSGAPEQILGLAPQTVALTTGALDDAVSAELLTQGSGRLDWSPLPAQRVSTYIRLGLLDAAGPWVGTLHGLPGTSHTDAALARSQVAYALGDYAGAMRLVGPALPRQLMHSWQAKEAAAMRLSYPPAHAAWVSRAAQEFGISDLLLLSVMRRESAFNARAASRVSAQGLMQIMPSTGRRIAAQLGQEGYEDGQLTRPDINIRFAAWYLRALVDKFGGNLALAIGSYNAGPNACVKWLQAKPHVETDVFVEDIPFRETRDYIKNVLANLEMYHRIYDGGGIQWAQATEPHVGDQVNF